jgi:cysteine desulfurase
MRACFEGTGTRTDRCREAQEPSEPSHVLRAMGVPDSAIGGSIRFSLSRYTTREEIEATMRILPRIIIEKLGARP